MYTELLDLFFEYTFSKRTIDKDFIEKALNIIIPYKNLEDYVSKFQIEKEDNDILAKYQVITKRIVLYEESIQRIINKKNRYEKYLSETEKHLYKNMLIFQCVLHEIEHAIQCKMIDSTYDSIEKRIIAISMEDITILRNSEIRDNFLTNKLTPEQLNFFYGRRNIYENFYTYAPQERLAEIRSFHELRKLINPVEYILDKTDKAFQTFIYDATLKGYKTKGKAMICPTIKYLYEMQKDEEFERIGIDNFKNVLKDYDYKTRIVLGLPITYEEYKDTYKKELEIHRTIKRK